MTRTGIAIAALALAVEGCAAPTAIWSGWSPDRSTRAIVVAADGAQRLTIGDAPSRDFDAIALEQLRWSDRGLVVPAERDGLWWMIDGAREHGPFLAVGLPVIAGAYVAFPARRADGWRVIAGEREGEAFDAIAGEIQLDAETGAYAYVARRRGAEHAVWGDRLGPPCALVALLGLGAKGAMIAYVDRGERDRLLVDHEQVGVWDEVLEVARARDTSRWAAIVADEGGCAVVHDPDPLPEGAPPPTHPPTFDVASMRLGAAPLLTHLRISDDGAHVACLAPAADGASIDVLVDGSTIAHHRRVEGDALAFVPGTSTLVVVSEDSQGPRITVGDRTSERYEEIALPVYAPGHVGWIGRRGGRSEVVLDGAVIADEEWAGSLRLAREGTGYAYAARAEGERFVVTRRGRWPVPRLFVDTLVVDDTAHHWGALVPDVGAHRLEIWIDGTPRAQLDEDELGGAMVVRGDAGALEAVRAIVRGELARATSAPSLSPSPSSTPRR